MPHSERTKVLLGISGGVDSSTAAKLLQQSGFDVFGITLKLWARDCANRAEDKCCGPEAVRDARTVCERLGIPHYLVDAAGEFQQRVIDYFAAEYRAGRTPNPCVMCNQHLKFGVLLDRAEQLGADFIATGHFARITKVTGRSLLHCGRDNHKDQSYFLFSMRQEQLARTLFPLGDLTKSETREVARQCQIKTAEKQESMEICFVPDRDYGKFLRDSGLVRSHQGEVVDVRGQVLGHHEGIEFYTIGQRKGLGISSSKPLYVIELDAENNRVVVGDDSALDRDEFVIQNCNWIPFDDPPACFEASVKIRYNHRGTPATVKPATDGRALVKLHSPQRAITPGQAAVCYQGDLVLGGGWIVR